MIQVAAAALGRMRMRRRTLLESALVALGRVIGKPPGWERVVRALVPPGRFRGRGSQPRRMREGYVFSVDPGTMIGWNVHLFGSYEPEAREWITAILKPGGVAVDVGANVGWHSLLMATLVGPSGQVHAFEPNPTTRERLAGDCHRNGFLHARVDGRALADRDGRLAFIAPQAGDLWDGTGRLVSGSVADARAVTCTSLDRFVEEQGIGRLDLLKIDVEGWELSVLRGARNVLEVFRPSIIFEYDPAYIPRCGGTGEELFSFLVGARYQLMRLSPRSRPVPVGELGRIGGNFLGIPAKVI